MEIKELDIRYRNEERADMGSGWIGRMGVIRLNKGGGGGRGGR